MQRAQGRNDRFWPLATLAIILLGALCGLIYSVALHFDTVAREREEAIVANGLDGVVSEVGRRVIPQAIWDDAVRHLDNDFDAGWARENIGAFLTATADFDAIFVIDAADRPRFASTESAGSVVEAYGPYAAAAAPLVTVVRAREATRAAAVDTLTDYIQVSSFASVNERIVILSATLVQPDFGHVRLSERRAPILVTALPVDEAFIEGIGRRFLLRGLHVHNRDSLPEIDQAHVTLPSVVGESVATIDWNPQTPGSDLIGRVGIPLVGALSALTLLALLLDRRASAMAQGLVASEARATQLAYFDTLTGLPNRMRLLERLDQALEHLRRDPNATFAVLSIDLRRFKAFSDHYGHHMCDQLIREVGRRLALQVRAVDTCARIGPDEFAIVQPNAGASQAAAFASRLLEVMQGAFDLDISEAFFDVSIGITVVTDGAMDAGEALRQADLALSRTRANNLGSAYGFFEIEMDAAVKTRRALEADLRAALAKGELEMVYQPQVKAKGVMTGVEALVRWRHPQRGFISPAYFVAMAEECGLIGELGLFTLARAFEDSRRWKGIKVAVNVSAIQLRTPGFVTTVSELVKKLRVDPRRFELEITESLLLGDDPDTHATLQRLRELGFSLALDDFGTGYSNLSYLKQFPISKIKIDQSFVANLGSDEAADAMVSAIIRLARALGLSVLAEGVETEDQRRRLAAAGCTEIQGYLYSQPLPAAGIDSLRQAAADRHSTLRLTPAAAA